MLVKYDDILPTNNLVGANPCDNNKSSFDDTSLCVIESNISTVRDPELK